MSLGTEDESLQIHLFRGKYSANMSVQDYYSEARIFLFVGLHLKERRSGRK